MAYQRLQVGRSLKVIPSDTVLIPDPATEALSGVTDGTTANKLVLSTATFLNDGIQAGKAIVYNTTDNTCAYVTAIDSDTVLSLSVNIMATGENFVIYNAATSGCVLYNGTAQDLTVYMAADTGNSHAPTTEQQFAAVPAGSFMPTFITGVKTTGSPTNLVALW